ncbi:acyl carrier protein [Actinoallomurus liliacearum]|uniref:Acyl carrier protein n=1 Tax=Actinoallomurus liliacearum TaxID=1080073 RepID=A0ABP8TMR0_9ACTN
MRVFTMEDLVGVLYECARPGQRAGLSGDIADIPLAELGYDSLGILEVAARIERRLNVLLGDDTVARTVTPADLVRLVNEDIAAAERAARK